jgi:CheY-like chemotaxis protein
MLIATSLSAQTANAGQFNILAVDDEAGSRTVLSLILKLAGHHAVVAKDGIEAMKFYEHAPIPFDLVITDHNMPGMNGLDVARCLRAKGFGGDICVATGYVGQIDGERYRALGVTEIIPKPLDIAAIRGLLEIVQERRNAGSA